MKNFKQLDGRLKEIKITGDMKNEKAVRDFLDLLDALLKIIRKFKPKIERLDFSGLQISEEFPDSEEKDENKFIFVLKVSYSL